MSTDYSGEPDFSPTNPPITVRNLHHTVEMGTYVTFFNDLKLLHGRIIRSRADASSVVMVTLNRYFRRTKLEQHQESAGQSDLLPNPLNNRFICVEELYRTNQFVEVPSTQIHGIIFVFQPDIFFSNVYEGCQQVFCIWYEINNINTMIPVTQQRYLPYPCSYKDSFPPFYRSYSFNINRAIQSVKVTVTKIMCRSTESHGRGFIKGSRTMNCGQEFWSYL